MASIAEDLDDDALQLKKNGYPQQLYRGLDFFTSFAFGFNDVSALVSIVSLFTYGLTAGGPGTMVWVWLICFFMTIIVALNFAEICSAFPIAGSVYNWSGVLSPIHDSASAAYWTGLFNWLGNAAGDSAFALTFSIFVNAAIVLSGFDSLTSDQEVAVAISVLFVWDVLNVMRIDELGWINSAAVFMQVATMIALIAILFDLSPKTNSAEYVFSKYYNATGFDLEGYVLVIGLGFGLHGFVGYDASAHLSEETAHAKISAPAAVLSTVMATGVSGFVLILSLLYNIQNLQSAIDGRSGNAALQIILQCTDSTIACVFAWLLTGCAFFTGLSGVTVTARVLFALLRDKAAGAYSDTMGSLHPELRSPVNILMFMFVSESSLLLLALIPNGGNTAFYSITGLCTAGLQIAYAFPVSYKVLSVFVPGHDEYVKSTLEATPFSLGFLSIPLGVIAAVWLWVTSAIFLLPTANPITSTNMNYTCVVLITAFIIGYINWQYNSKYYFKGPYRPEDAQEDDDEDRDAFHLKGTIKRLTTTDTEEGDDDDDDDDDLPKRRGPSETWRLIASEAADAPLSQRRPFQGRRGDGREERRDGKRSGGGSGSGSGPSSVVYTESV